MGLASMRVVISKKAIIQRWTARLFHQWEGGDAAGDQIVQDERMKAKDIALNRMRMIFTSLDVVLVG